MQQSRVLNAQQLATTSTLFTCPHMRIFIYFWIDMDEMYVAHFHQCQGHSQPVTLGQKD